MHATRAVRANGKLVAKQIGGYTDLDGTTRIERLGYRQEYNLSADAGQREVDVYSVVLLPLRKGLHSSLRFLGVLPDAWPPTSNRQVVQDGSTLRFV